MRIVYSVLIAAFALSPAIAQQSKSTAEDSLGTGSSQATSIGGYGNAYYSRDFNEKTATANLARVVLFVGHQFNERITFFSELEVEDAKVSGGEDGGEIAFEQAYVRFALDRNHSVAAGLFLPRIGILNEDHLPTSFYGNERTQVETWILPSTWREIGVGLQGNLEGYPLSYSVALLNGLNSAAFEHGSGIREGRYEGRNASANNLALTGALRWSRGPIRTQVSGYYGGTVGVNASMADSLKLNGGLFGTPIAIGEADLQYEASGIRIRLLGTIVSIPNAFEIDRAYDNNTPQREYGAYAELGYDFLAHREEPEPQSLIAFIRYETLDMNASIPSNGITDGTLNQQHVIFGINYLPMPNVVIKADVRLMQTGDQNPVLNAGPAAQAFKTSNTFFNLGIGFSF
jgi:hypothetical protein